MEVIGTRRKALHHEVQQPGETDAHGTTDPAERDTLAQQVFNQCAPLVRNDGSINAGTKLALACFTLMILFTMAGMAIFLVPLCSTRWARLSHDYSYCWPP